jgi:cholesterol 25-hydroxylase
MPLLLLNLTMIKKFADIPLERMHESGNYNYYCNDGNPDLATHHGHGATSFVQSLRKTTASSPLQTHRALPSLPPTSRRVALELAASFVLYDTLSFLFHLALHVLPTLER